MKKGKIREKRHLINDAILLKIHRLYEHDEAVKILEAEISRLKQEIGILQSEKSELSDEKTKLKTLIAKIPEEVIVSVGGIPLTIEENPLIPQKFKKEIKKLTKDVAEWRNKYFQIFHQRQKEF